MLSLSRVPAAASLRAHCRAADLRGARPARAALRVVSLRDGVQAEGTPPVDGKIQLTVKISGAVTKSAVDAAVTELGRTVGGGAGQRKGKGGKVKPLPRGMIMSILGKKRINQFVVDGLVTETVCDYASENDLQVRTDLSAAECVAEIDDLRSSFVSGEELAFVATTEVRRMTTE